MLNLTRVGHIVLTWGESLRWDDHRQRLYCVDCATQTLHWLDHGDPPLHSLSLPTMPAGVVLTNGERLVVCLDDGLYVVDPDAGTWELLAAYPKGMHGRANDANADGSGNLITGTLNVTRAPGASWWFSAVEGWRLLDDDIGNANGPVVIDVNGQPTLVFADTPARVVYAYPYNGEIGTIGERCRRGRLATRRRWTRCHRPARVPLSSPVSRSISVWWRSRSPPKRSAQEAKHSPPYLSQAGACRLLTCMPQRRSR